jgi:ATP-dependent helicase STH1/SNF2
MSTTRWNVCLTTNDFIMRDRNVLRKHHWQYVVVDEGHRMKNKESSFAKVMMREYDFKHRLLLTGTPLQNNLNELWALLNFLLPKVFNCSDDFQKWFSIPISSTRREAIKLNQE